MNPLLFYTIATDVFIWFEGSKLWFWPKSIFVALVWSSLPDFGHGKKQGGEAGWPGNLARMIDFLS